MSEDLRDILRDSVTRLFADKVTRAVLEGAETGAWPADLWAAIEEAGLNQPLVPEAAGGVGASWSDAYVIARAAGYYAAPIPLVETMLAGALLAGAGIAVPPGPIAVAPVRPGEKIRFDRGVLAGRASGVPWGLRADHVLVLAEGVGGPCLVLARDPEGTADTNIASEPRDSLDLGVAHTVADAPLDDRWGVQPICMLGAMLRTAQMAGGLSRALDEAVRYAQDRTQFGRPIGKFQAIQHQLAVLAGKSAQSAVAAEAAFRAAGRAADLSASGAGGHPIDRADPWYEIACAKIVVGEAVGEGAAIAHQVHAALGFTYEHALHFVTRRLWSWRGEFGSESVWADRLGRHVTSRGADAMWPDLTAR